VCDFALAAVFWCMRVDSCHIIFAAYFCQSFVWKHANADILAFVESKAVAAFGAALENGIIWQWRF